MRRLLAVARTGVASALLHPLRSGVTVACVVAILAPFVAGIGVSRGLRDEAEASVAGSPDLHVTGTRLGRVAPLPLAAVEAVRAIPGVLDVTPRIVGEIRLGRESVSAVLVGLPADRLPRGTDLVRGRLFAPGAPFELVVGASLAARLGLDVGSRIPPFYRNAAGERVSTVVGVFRSDLPPWSAQVVLASLETASAALDANGLATSLLVRCRPESIDAVRSAILALPTLSPDDGHGPLRARVTSRDDLEALVPAGLLRREAAFDAILLLAFAVGIPLVLATSGVGLAERRRETGLLKATGWQTDEVLVRAAAESLLLATAGASLAILAAWAWLGVLGGAGVAGVFLSGAEGAPDVRVPFRLLPVPALLAFVVSYVVVATGTLVSSWRAASATPAEALR